MRKTCSDLLFIYVYFAESFFFGFFFFSRQNIHSMQRVNKKVLGIHSHSNLFETDAELLANTQTEHHICNA